jgi:TPR repeat protein
MNYIADIYIYGKGVNIDYEEAIRWLKRASDLEDDIAMNTIGYLYYTSNNDYNNAIIWFKKAVKYNNSDAMSNLGYVYLKLNNKNEAIKWFKMAHEFGDKYAEKELEKLFKDKEIIQ